MLVVTGKPFVPHFVPHLAACPDRLCRTTVLVVREDGTPALHYFCGDASKIFSITGTGSAPSASARLWKSIMLKSLPACC